MAFPVAVEMIHRAEAKLGRKLPTAYVVKMCRENGGEVEFGHDLHWFLFPVFDDSDKKRLKRTCNDIVRETQQMKSWPGFPPEAVAIGDNQCGDKLILLPDPEAPSQFGHAVYWWDHETDEIIRLADGFDDRTDC